MVFFKTRLLKALAAFVLLLAVAGCGDSYKWNQKMTIEFETPSGVKTGSSITSVRWNGYRNGNPLFGDAAGATSKVLGEAVTVNLGGGKYLFGLISNASTIALRTFSEMPSGTYAVTRLLQPAKEAANSKGQSRILNQNSYPLLVTFDDINDPASVKRVDPNDLAATFGRGYALKSITLEITDEPVTEGKVESVLGWLNWPREKLLEAGGGRNPVQLEINGGLRALGRTEFRKK